MRFLDLFAGAGGMSLGLQNAGFQHGIGVEIDADARATYEKNIGPCIGIDLGSAAAAIKSLRDAGPFDLVVGGPPCTDFSSVGLRDQTRGSADLTGIFGLLVSALKPRVFIMENVASSRDSDAYRFAMRGLAGIRYGIASVVVEAARLGVPQQRRRLITVGVRDSLSVDRLPDLVEGAYSLQPLSMQQHGDQIGHVFPPLYYVHPRARNRRGIWSSEAPCATVRGVNRPIPPGYRRHPNDAGDPRDARPLTTTERALVQTFPLKYEFVGCKTSIEKQIGNAVPPMLAQFVGEQLREILAIEGILAVQRVAANAQHQRRRPTLFDVIDKGVA